MPDYKKTEQQFKDLDIYKFKNTPFEDLCVSRSYYSQLKMDRRYRDNLEASHIK